ncbi:cation:proton antiporter [Oscillospiraceae bacterium LTW-04]|nr:cation:proton antiporter [Oscillospiraceae bacterium MB24-C1]
MLQNIFRLLIVILLAVCAGKLASKVHMPAVLGFLMAGMLLGPHAFNLLTQEILDAPVYHSLMSILECGMGLMLGTEAVWKKMRVYGSQILIITLVQSLSTFVLVSAAFAAIFYYMGIPVFLGLIFGGIALATAPAPALSIVTEYKTEGPVTRTLIPMAVLDDIIAITVFLTVMSIVVKKTASATVPSYIILFVVLFPLIIGLLVGVPVALILKRCRSNKVNAFVVFFGALLAAIFTMWSNKNLMPFPILNFMLSGMAYSACFANIISTEKLDAVMKYCNPLIGACFTLIILNLGVPLDCHLILGAGTFTAVYIIMRAAGKIGGAALGGYLSNAPTTVKKYLGLTLMPHSGVSLVLTGIAISSLTGVYSQYRDIVLGTIAAAAVINEIIAVFAAKQGFKMAGEMGKANG